MTDLITRLKQAREGSRELDVEVFLAITNPRQPRHAQFTAEELQTEEARALAGVAHYTTSVDDCRRYMVPEGFCLSLEEANAPGRTDWGVVLTKREEMPKPPYVFHRGRAESPALALCIASLKAKGDAQP